MRNGFLIACNDGINEHGLIPNTPHAEVYGKNYIWAHGIPLMQYPEWPLGKISKPPYCQSGIQLL